MRLAPMNAERSMPYRPTAADIIDTSAQRLDMADDVSEFRRRIRGALFRVAGGATAWGCAVEAIYRRRVGVLPIPRAHMSHVTH